MRKGRGSGLGIGEVGGEDGAGGCGSYRQKFGVGFNELLKRTAQIEWWEGVEGLNIKLMYDIDVQRCDAHF